MLETLRRPGGEYTIKELSALLGFSTYSKHFQKLTLWPKLKNEQVFVENGCTKTGAIVYYFDWERLRNAFANSNMVNRAIKATRRKIDRVIG